MRLLSFQIENIKSVVNSGVCHLSDSDNILVLAGQNEAGKSAILEALNYFGNGPDDRFIKLSKRLNAEPKVTCTFLIEDKDCNTDNEEMNKLLKTVGTVECCRSGITEEDDGLNTSEATDAAVKKIIDGIDFSAGVAEENTETEPSLRETAIQVKKGEFFEDTISHIFGSLPDFVLYDSFTGLLPGEIKVSDIPSHQAVQDFQKIFGVDFADAITKNAQERTSIIDSVEKKAELDLNTYWTQKRVDGIEDKYRFNINLIPSGPESKIEFLIHRDDGTPLFMEQKSKGFQWFNAFMLRLKAIGVEDANLGNYILLIDEPGQGLHETAQKNVKVVLGELSKKGMQILYTTHNPSLIGVTDDELLQIRLVFQSKDNGTKINTITQFASSKEGASKDALSPIITAMGISHLGQIIDTSKLCVVVEGITDHYYFTAFQQLLSLPNDHSFIPACGVKNVKPLVSILIGWGARFKAVFDDGKDGKNVYKDLASYLFKNDEDGLKKVVKKMDGFDGIEDLFTKDDFYARVLNESVPTSSTSSNSEIAKERKKELIARIFLEEVKSGTITKGNLQQKTLDHFSEILNWLTS